MDYVEVGGLRVAFERRGQGPPLVLLHGWPTNSREWRRQLDALSDEVHRGGVGRAGGWAVIVPVRSISALADRAAATGSRS